MKLKMKDLGIICFLITSCFTFILENMIFKGDANSYIVSMSIMLFSLFCAILINGREVKGIIEYSWTWGFYIAVVSVSLIRRSFAVSAMCDVLVIIFVLVCVITFKRKTEDFKCGIKFLYVIGIVNAFAVLLQFVLGDAFNNVYWSLLTDKWKDYSELYFNMGYYMGIQSVPGHAAGAIIYTIGISVCLLLLAKYQKRIIRFKAIYFVGIGVLALAVLLTGKKGSIVAGMLAIVILFITLLMQKKQWIRMLIFLLMSFLGVIVFRWYALSHSEVTFFARFAKFFIAIEEGNVVGVTTGRNYLYGYAIELFKKHVLLGNGWRTFRDYTVSMYGYDSKHDVNFDYLQMLCEFGIVGFVFIMIPVLITLIRTIKLERSILLMDISFAAKFAIIVAGFIQLFTLIYAFFEIPFYDRTFFVVYAFSCIIINNAYREYCKKGMVVYEGRQNR